MNKVLTVLKRDGLGGLLRKIFRRVRRYTFSRKRVLKKLLAGNYRKIIVFENGLGWERIMRQRPQQIALNFPEDVLFLYGSSYPEYDNAVFTRRLSSNAVLLDLNVYRKPLMELLAERDEKYLMIYSTDFTDEALLNRYIQSGFSVLYEFVDSIDPDLSSREHCALLQCCQDRVFALRDAYVVCTATRLLELARAANPNLRTALVTNGADYAHFHSAAPRTPVALLEQQKAAGRCIVGYYGALAKWFDYDLLRRLAENQHYAVVLLGVDYDGTFAGSGLAAPDNVFYLGPKRYDELLDYASYFDVCTIPFLINDITRSTSPVKLFEYMAMNKPIVTTALPECRKYRSVLTAETPEEFCEKIAQAEKLAQDKDYLALLDREARENSWQNKCEEILRLLDK